MTLFQHIMCPCGIIRAMVILTIALVLSIPVQMMVFPAASRIGVYLLTAAFLDILSRLAGTIREFSKEKKEKRDEVPGTEKSKMIRGLFLSDHGGLILVPVWLGCLAIYLYL